MLQFKQSNPPCVISITRTAIKLRPFQLFLKLARTQDTPPVDKISPLRASVLTLVRSTPSSMERIVLSPLPASMSLTALFNQQRRFLTFLMLIKVSMELEDTIQTLQSTVMEKRYQSLMQKLTTTPKCQLLIFNPREILETRLEASIEPGLFLQRLGDTDSI